MNHRSNRLRTRRRSWIAGIVALLVLCVADHRGWLLARGPDDVALYDGARARVCRVIDGCTLEVGARDPVHDRTVTLVRLWGVRCPRPAGPERTADRLSGETRALVARLAAGRTVVLGVETHRTRDTAGRVLAHVRLPGGVSLNERLLAEGLARADERWPHARLTRYAEIERAARRRGAGLWAD